MRSSTKIGVLLFQHPTWLQLRENPMIPAGTPFCSSILGVDPSATPFVTSSLSVRKIILNGRIEAKIKFKNIQSVLEELHSQGVLFQGSLQGIRLISFGFTKLPSWYNKNTYKLTTYLLLKHRIPRIVLTIAVMAENDIYCNVVW